MKKSSYIFFISSVLAAMLLSACGAAVSAEKPVSAIKGNASLVEFTGVIDAINGDQWTVNGQIITVDPAVIKDGPFKVGDKVKVEADVQADGSVVITRVETPVATPIAGLTDVPVVPSPTDDSLSTPEAISTPDPAAPGIVFDNSGSEAFGTVDSFDGTTIVIGGQSFTVANGAEIKDSIAAGNFVKVEFTLNADGSMSIRQIQLWDPAAVGSDNSNENSISGSDDGANHDMNDDHGNDGPDHDQNDDSGNDDGSHDQNDDNGGGNSGSDG